MQRKFYVRNNFAALLDRDTLRRSYLISSIGATKQQFSRWVLNLEQPHVGYVLRIAKLTGWTIEEMFEERGEQE